MFLSVKTLPVYSYSMMRKFYQGERHITRNYPRAVLIFMCSGVLRFTENGKKIELKKGEYYIQQDGLMQIGNLDCDEPEYFFIEFSGVFNEDADGIPIRGMFSDDSFGKLIHDLNKEEAESNGTLFRKYSLVLRIFDKLWKTTYTKKDSLSHEISDYLYNHYKENISIKELEKLFSYSSNHIINVFRNEFSMTPYQYVKKLRIDEAKILMLTTERSLDNIAYECGYANFSTFYRNFYDCEHIQPSAWRSKKLKLE